MCAICVPNLMEIGIQDSCLYVNLLSGVKKKKEKSDRYIASYMLEITISFCNWGHVLLVEIDLHSRFCAMRC